MPHKRSDTHHRGFHCSDEWHLIEYGAAALAIYGFLSTLTAGGKNLYTSSKLHLAKYFNRHPDTIADACAKMVDGGWLLETGLDNDPKDYRTVPHLAWAAAHPGKCYQPEPRPWDGEDVDPLVKKLYAASGGQRWERSMVIALHKRGCSDDAIVAMWKVFCEEASASNNRGHIPNGRAFKWQFVKAITQREVVDK